MQQPDFQHKFERMVRDQKEILVEAAYGDGRTWESFAQIYRFAPPDAPALRSYIRSSYRPDGTPQPPSDAEQALAIDDARGHRA